MTIVTGFDAYAGRSHNPSQNLVEEIAPHLSDQIETLILPTSYERAWQQLRRAMEPLTKRSLVMFGYGKSAVGLRLERYARNQDTSKNPDNDGVVRSGPIIDGAPDRLPVRAVRPSFQRLYEAGIPVELSSSAGGFVCNHILYRALYESPGLGGPGLILFAHVSDWEASPHHDAVVRGARLLVDSVTGLVTRKPNRRIRGRDL